MPVLQWDGEELAQTMAIVKFVARMVGMASAKDEPRRKEQSSWEHFSGTIRLVQQRLLTRF